MGNNDAEGQYLEAAADSTLRPSKASSLCEVEGQDSQRGMTTPRPRPVRGKDTGPPATLALRTGLGLSLLRLGAGRCGRPLCWPLRHQQAPSPLSPPQTPHNCFPMLLMEARLLMPKPWVGGGWVRADQGSQGSKAAQAGDL